MKRVHKPLGRGFGVTGTKLFATSFGNPIRLVDWNCFHGVKMSTALDLLQASYTLSYVWTGL
jgi:hypothetical protein